MSRLLDYSITGIIYHSVRRKSLNIWIVLGPVRPKLTLIPSLHPPFDPNNVLMPILTLVGAKYMMLSPVDILLQYWSVAPTCHNHIWHLMLSYCVMLILIIKISDLVSL